MFYKNSRKKIEDVIKKYYPNVVPCRYKGTIKKENLPEHVLWMVYEMNEWDCSSIKRATKAGRWIGWMFRAMEELNIWSNEDSRHCAKSDVELGFHLPENGNV